MIVRDKLISTRATTILSRFPRHLDLTREDKVFAQVVNGLARELDVKTLQIGRVRKSHRIDQAEAWRDLLLLAGIHDLRPIRFDIARLRLDALADVAATLKQAGGDTAATETAINRLRDLLALSDLGGYGTDHTGLLSALQDLTDFPSRRSVLRAQIKELIRIHRDGNGSVRSLLEASAAYLHLRVNRITHVGDDYWHIAYCSELLTLSAPDQGGAAPVVTEDWLALEENPFKETTIDPEPFAHGDTRKIVRNGFDPVPVTITITGIENRTCFPMIVDVGKGYGLYYAGTVDDGSVLQFTADGRVLLDDAPADNQAFAFTGAVFADDTGLSTAAPTEFAFCTDHGTAPYGQGGVFIETEPVSQGFSAALPHMGGLAPAITLAVGATNLQFFVRIAHCGVRTTAPVTDRSAVESYSAGHFDRSLFALNASGAGAVEADAEIGFAWQEREAFKVRVWLPSRLAAYDSTIETDTPPLVDRLQPLLDRHRAAGIKLDIRSASDLWQLPHGYITDPDSPQSYTSITSGSRLWNSGSPQPTS